MHSGICLIPLCLGTSSFVKVNAGEKGDDKHVVFCPLGRVSLKKSECFKLPEELIGQEDSGALKGQAY